MRLTRAGIWLAPMRRKLVLLKLSSKRVPPIESVSEQDFYLNGMTAIVMGDVNAENTLRVCSPPTTSRCSCNVHVDSSPIEVQRADALYDFSQIPPNAGKSGSTLSRKCWGGRQDVTSGTLGFLFERRVSLMLTTVLIAAVGVHRTLLQHLLVGGRSPFLFGENVRQPRRVSHSSRHFASMQTVPSERGSVRRASACQRAC